MIPLMSIGWLAIKELRDDSHRTAVNQVQDNLQLITHAFNSVTGTAKANAELLAISTLSKQNVRIQDKKQPSESLKPYLLQLFKNYRHAYPEFEEISLVFPDGFEDIRVGIATGDHQTEKERTPSSFERLNQSEADLITEIRRHSGNGEVGLYVFRRLFDPAQSATYQNNPSTYGYLGLKVSLKQLYSNLEKYKIGQNVRILFINKQGEILLDTYHQATNSHLPVVLWKAVQSDAFTKRPRRYHFFNQTFLIQTKAVDSHLYALVALPVSELEEPIKRPKIAVLLATLSALILYTTLVYGGLQRIVLQPLEELNRATQEIAQGNVKTEAKISSRDELKDLSNSIHQIGEKLASYTDAADNQTVSDTREGSTTGKTN